MTSKFRNHDRPGPQVVSIVWDLIVDVDDDQEAPDERYDGFWPSIDPTADGWIGDNPAKSFEQQQAECKERLAAFQRGDWLYVGVRAKVIISVPIGQGSFTTYELESAGLWGIESDDAAHIAATYAEERASLLDHLKIIGAAVMSGDYREHDNQVTNPRKV